MFGKANVSEVFPRFESYFSLIGFVVDISSKLNVPEIVSGYPRFIHVAIEYTYLNWGGVRLQRGISLRI